MVGLLGPQDDLERFIIAWVDLASNAALKLAAEHFPDIQLIPLQETDAEV